MVARDLTKTIGSPNVEVGEVDTSAPFQSVKDAVNLFGDSFSGGKTAIKKPKEHSAERVLEKKTQIHLVQKELNKLKEQLKTAEETKAQALVELEGAKKTVEDLTHKLKLVSESKDFAAKAREAAKNQVKQLKEASDGPVMGMDGSWKVDLETTREECIEAVTELDTAKEKLRKIRRDGDTAMEEKASALFQTAEAERTAKANMERAGKLSKEIVSVQESIEQLKLACLQERKEEAKIYVEKDFKKQAIEANIEDAAKQLLALRKYFDADLSKSLEAQYAEALSKIEALQKEKDCARASDLVLVRAVTKELGDAKESLLEVAEEESMLQTLVESLKLELEKVKKEHSDLKEKEAEIESLADSLHVKLRRAKSELEVAVTEESKLRGASVEMISTFHQLTSETENARLEAEQMMKQAAELKKEADATRVAFEEAENKLQVELEEAEKAKSAEGCALDQNKMLAERTRASTSESSACTISKDEFDSLNRKVKESEKLARKKVEAAMAQLEAVKASENEALKRLDATQKEIEDMKTSTQEALKMAEMAECAKKAVEGELRRRREREQKKAAEAVSRMLAQIQTPSRSSPRNYRSEKENILGKSLESHLMNRRSRKSSGTA